MYVYSDLRQGDPLFPLEFREVKHQSKLMSSSIYVSDLASGNHITTCVTRCSHESYPRRDIYRTDGLPSIVFAVPELQKPSGDPARLFITIQLEIDYHVCWLPHKRHDNS